MLEILKEALHLFVSGFMAVLIFSAFTIQDKEFGRKKKEIFITGLVFGIFVTSLGMFLSGGNTINETNNRKEKVKQEMSVEKEVLEETKDIKEDMSYREIDINKVAHKIKTVHDKDKVGQNRPLAIDKAREYAQEIDKWSKHYDLDPKIVLAIAKAETNFIVMNKFWDRKGYSLGLYSMRETTVKNIWKDFWFLDDKGIAYKPYKAIDPLNYGTKLVCFHIDWLRDKFYTKSEVITAYNRGVKGTASVNPVKYDYTVKVNDNYKQFANK